MNGWNPKQHNPLTDAPPSPRITAKAEPEDEHGLTINGQPVALPWPFLAPAEPNIPTIDILVQD